MYSKILIIILIISPFRAVSQNFTIARIHYSGGGDWYSDPSSLPNLLKFLGDNTNIAVADEEVRFRPTDKEFYQYPYQIILQFQLIQR